MATEEISQLNQLQQIGLGTIQNTKKEKNLTQNQFNAYNCGATEQEALEFGQDTIVSENQVRAFCTGKITLKESLQFNNKYQVRALETGKVTVKEALWFNDWEQCDVLINISGNLSSYYIDKIDL